MHQDIVSKQRNEAFAFFVRIGSDELQRIEHDVGIRRQIVLVSGHDCTRTPEAAASQRMVTRSRLTFSIRSFPSCCRFSDSNCSRSVLSVTTVTDCDRFVNLRVVEPIIFPPLGDVMLRAAGSLQRSLLLPE